MPNAILICGDADRDLHRYDCLWTISIVRKKRLRRRGFPVQCLFDVSLPASLDTALQRKVENALLAESEGGGTLRWAPLAFQHVYWRFARYYQFKLRLSRLVDSSGVTELQVTSDRDVDLSHAAAAVCEQRSIPLKVDSGGCDEFSSILPYLAAYDLPERDALSSEAISRAVALFYSFADAKTLYHWYNNIGAGLSQTRVLSWTRSIAARPIALAKRGLLGRARTDSLVNLKTVLRRSIGVSLKGEYWHGFDVSDLICLSSAFSYFTERYPPDYIDKLHNRLTKFLSSARTERIVLSADNTCSVRLLARAARTIGIGVDYLPHGLIWEDLSFSTRTQFSSRRVMAWNESSKRRYEALGLSSEEIAHPCNAGETDEKRRFGSNLSRLRILLMPPEWIGVSFAGRMDCFEHDLLEVLEGLTELGVPSVDVKYHHSLPEVITAKSRMLTAVNEVAEMKLNVLPSAISTRELMGRYDLVVVGPTTGILEASRSSTPFVVYRGFIERAGLFDRCTLPCAGSPEELVRVIRNYDFDLVDDECRRLNQSLQHGQHPLDRRFIQAAA